MGYLPPLWSMTDESGRACTLLPATTSPDHTTLDPTTPDPTPQAASIEHNHHRKKGPSLRSG
jgi:hypothetical protein